MDAATLTIFNHLFASVAEEMGVTLGRTAYSPNIKERLDYSCAVFLGGERPKMLAQAGVERVRGPHCYEMYANGQFDALMAEAPGTYFLTDYLVQSFEHLVIEGMGLDRFPELRDEYFRNYTRCVYLAQTDDPALRAKAEWAAQQLRLPLEVRRVGYGALETRLLALLQPS